ncbi:MAG: type II toxin-antitoxin system VapC family toxin [Chloroflexi bacterium]|nr:type II toxin-antitoxin system VapC family toxin [Chloroflexota bacterium]
MSYLLDTNVLSEVRKPNANSNVRAWLASVKGIDLYLSVLVVGEIRLGIERLRRRDPSQAGVYETWLATVHRDYADRILPVTIDIAEEWARMQVPNALPVIDGLVAATAKVHGLTLVTRNTAHFVQAGVRSFNPFEESGPA